MEQKCENCRFFCKLNLFARYVGTVGGIGCVSGWRVEKMHSKPHDVCELFKPKETEEHDYVKK